MDSTQITHRALVIGSPIAHSLSPVLHNAGYEAAGLSGWEYTRAEVVESQVADFVAGLGSEYRGISVTMPNKFAALALADEVTDRARVIGSANTLVRLSEDRWRADNTDTEGIVGALCQLCGVADQPALQGVLAGQRAVIVGGGGTARPALWVLATLGVSHITVLNRTDKRGGWNEIVASVNPLVELHWCDFSVSDTELEAVTRSAGVVISTVPSAVISGREVALAHAPVLDVIYDPRPTPLTRAAQMAGFPAVEGDVMLAHQAFSQFEQFTGQPAPREAMIAALQAVL